MSRIERWLATPDARWIIAIFALALIVRLALVAYVHPNPRDGRYDDSVFYDSAARHLAAGQGYVFDPTVFVTTDGHPIYPGEHSLTATALWPPGYPATLGVVYKLTGDSLWAGRLLNVLLGALTSVLVFLIARRMFDLTAAVFAGLVLTFLPGHLLFTAVLLSETEFGFLLAAITAVCVYFVFPSSSSRPVRKPLLSPAMHPASAATAVQPAAGTISEHASHAGERPNLLLLAGLGVLTAFAGFVRGEFLAFGGVIALLLLIRYGRRSALPLVALAVGAAVIITPWVVRNEVQMHAFVVGTTGSGRVAYQGHNPDTNGGDSLISYFALERPYEGLDRTEIEVKANDDGARLARQYALHHKLRELQLIPKRMYLLFRSDESGVSWIQSNKPWFTASGADKLIRASSFTFYGLIALALAGAPLWFRRRDLAMWLVLAVVPFYMLIFGVLFIGYPRYHYALYIPLSIFSSVALAEIWRMTAERWRQVAGGRTVASVARSEAAGR